ncbi:hypothetical protein AVW15_13075 [Chelatococcus daeguensis]|nr:hypothetical protein AVW15_13075 [Chelatococcus daeguensis]
MDWRVGIGFHTEEMSHPPEAGIEFCAVAACYIRGGEATPFVDGRAPKEDTSILHKRLVERQLRSGEHTPFDDQTASLLTDFLEASLHYKMCIEASGTARIAPGQPHLTSLFCRDPSCRPWDFRVIEHYRLRDFGTDDSGNRGTVHEESSVLHR